MMWSATKELGAVLCSLLQGIKISALRHKSLVVKPSGESMRELTLSSLSLFRCSRVCL